jgi:hypothetical protein
MPRRRTINCSTGPPGTNWQMVKQTKVMPMKVGITSSRRRMK